MPDYGSRIADKAIDQTARKIRGVYKDAWFDIRKKMDDFTKRHIKKNAEMMQKLKAGEITKAEYDSWMRGQVFMGKQWDMKLDQIAKIMGNANKEAVGVVRNGSFNVFAENYNHTAYELEKLVGGAVNFNLYNEESVARLIKKNPKMLPEWKINERKDYAWNRQKVENAITQGIIQGEGIDKITDRLADALITTNENRMRTFARTGITGAQNAGRLKQMKDAEEEGIKVKKRWIATLDSRTRDTHQELDGQEVPVDQPFEVDGMEIMFPGDPNADPSLVYNCRCTMIEVYEGIDRKSVRRDEDDNAVEDMTYKEWKEAKENGTLNTEKKLVEKPRFDESKEEITAKAEVKGYRETTLQMYDEALGWAQEAYDSKLNDLREGWANVPSQIEAINDFEKNIPTFEKTIKDAVSENDFVTRTNGGSVVEILKDGRMKSQIETGKSNGYLDVDRRKRVADQLFAGSESLQIKDTEYEIYGYLGDSPRANMYGDCKIVFKKDGLIDRTTITVGDSLELLETGADPMATLAKDPKIMSYGDIFSDSIPNAPDQLKNARRDFESIREKGYLSDGGYIELQFHGGVSVDDIDYIEVPKSLANADEIESLANEKGVKIKWKK